MVAFGDHDALTQRASLVVGNGGHGTTMRALKHGVPMVGIPAKGADQSDITQLIEHWHAGRALPTDAGIAQIRDAAAGVLADPSYRQAAVDRSHPLARSDGAGLAATSVESLISARAQRWPPAFDHQRRYEGEAIMYAVVVRATISDPETAESELRAHVVPRVSQAPGFVTGHWTRNNGTGIARIIFESEETATSVSERLRATPTGGSTIEDVEVREVVGHV